MLQNIIQNNYSILSKLSHSYEKLRNTITELYLKFHTFLSD